MTGNSGTNRLYLNNGSANPWSGVSGSDITTHPEDTRSVALGDVDADGDLDPVTGNRGVRNRLYRGNAFFDTARGRGTSLEIDTETGGITNATLSAWGAPAPNTSVDFWLSNDGGTKWFLVRTDVRFDFPSPGDDLRWRVELRSLSPALTPIVSAIQIFSDDPCSLGTPGEVTDLLLTHVGGVGGTTTLSWTPPAVSGGPGVVYDTIGSLNGFDFAGAAAFCVESDDGSDTSALDTTELAPGDLLSFLTRAGNACGEGDAGTDSDGVPRPFLACP